MTDPMPWIEGLLAPLLDPSHRIYWPFLVGSLAIAVALALCSGVRLRSALAPSLWLHPSARLDYKLWLLKRLAKVAGLLVLPLSSLVVARWTLGGLVGCFGALEPADSPAWFVCALFSVSLFVAWDFSRYLLHRLMHRIPALWALHQVHHSAEVLTPMTFYRTHPIESLLYQLRGVLVAGVMTGLFFWLFQGSAVTWQLVGVDAIGFAFNLFGGNLRHSHVWLSYGRLERWLISPAQHQLHHAPQGCQQNYGAWLATWDRIGGTWLAAGKERALEFGLSDVERNHRPDSLVSVLWRPAVASLSLCVPRGWRYAWPRSFCARYHRDGSPPLESIKGRVERETMTPVAFETMAHELGDYERIAAVRNAAWPDHPLSATELMYDAGVLRQKKDLRSALAVDDGVDVAALWLVHDGRVEHWSVDVMVRPEARTSSIGSGLIDQVERMLSDVEVRSLTVTFHDGGLARALKVQILRQLKERGFRAVVTENADSNPLVGLNARLGFVSGGCWLIWRRGDIHA